MNTCPVDWMPIVAGVAVGMAVLAFIYVFTKKGAAPPPPAITTRRGNRQS